jgi:hypothetical protein
MNQAVTERFGEFLTTFYQACAAGIVTPGRLYGSVAFDPAVVALAVTPRVMRATAIGD